MFCAPVAGPSDRTFFCKHNCPTVRFSALLHLRIQQYAGPCVPHSAKRWTQLPDSWVRGACPLPRYDGPLRTAAWHARMENRSARRLGLAS